MCDGDRMCPQCEYERIRRKDLKDKINGLIACLNWGSEEEEFLTIKDELISLVDKID